MKIFLDWSWRPDEVASAAIRRGDAKVRAFHADTRSLLFNFRADPPRTLTPQEIEARERDRQLVRTYLERIAALEPAPAAGKQQAFKGGRMNMQWAALIVKTNDNQTRVVSKHASDMEARKAGGALPDIDTFTVVNSGEPLTELTDEELNALMEQFEDKRTDVGRPLKELFVRGYLEQFDSSFHDAGGKVSNGHYKQPAIPKELQMESTATATSTPKKKATGSKPAAKKKAAPPPATAKKKGAKNGGGGKGAAAREPKKPTARQKLQDKGDGLGRPGTPARFIREAYLKGESTKDIFAAVVKKFPNNAIKSTSYVSWYYNDMVKRDLLDPKKVAKGGKGKAKEDTEE